MEPQRRETATPPAVPAAGEVTALLQVASAGDRGAFDRAFALVYDELRAVAERQLRREVGGDALRTTELVNELYLKLVGQFQISVVGRAHFYALAARAMRQILIDVARRRGSAKRGGEWVRTTLSGAEAPIDTRLDDVVALDELLDRLPERQRRIVEYRFFGGMGEEDIAQVLGVSGRTVQREWLKARAWLYRELYDQGG